MTKQKSHIDLEIDKMIIELNEYFSYKASTINLSPQPFITSEYWSHMKTPYMQYVFHVMQEMRNKEREELFTTKLMENFK